MEDVHIGQKLIIEDLLNEDWQKIYADPVSLSAMLKECGISFVELSINNDTENSTIINLAELFSQTGLFISLHPYFFGILSPEVFIPENIPLFKQKLQTAQNVGNITGVPVSYVFHGGLAMWEPNFVGLKEAIVQSKNFFSWIDKAVIEEFGNIVPLCETQMPYSGFDKQKVRLGDTWETCLNLIEETSLGICWDYGHTFIGSANGIHNRFPDDHFLARVNHVHAHDTISTEYGLVDHQPLADGEAPWREYNALLARHDFNGNILLEINPRSYSDLESFLVGTTDGVRKMRSFFG